MQLSTKNFLKKLLNKHLLEDHRYQVIIETLLSEKRIGKGEIIYTSLNLFSRSRRRPSIVSNKMRYQEQFDLLEKKEIIKRDNYNYIVDPECIPYLIGEKKIEQLEISPTHQELSDHKKKQIYAVIKTKLKNGKYKWVNQYPQNELDCLLNYEISALIDCYEKNKTVSVIWVKYQRKLEKLYRGKKPIDETLETENDVNRTFRRHLKLYDEILIEKGVIKPYNSITIRKGKL